MLIIIIIIAIDRLGVGCERERRKNASPLISPCIRYMCADVRCTTEINNRKRQTNTPRIVIIIIIFTVYAIRMRRQLFGSMNTGCGAHATIIAPQIETIHTIIRSTKIDTNHS